jgi:hypothetical protein
MWGLVAAAMLATQARLLPPKFILTTRAAAQQFNALRIPTAFMFQVVAAAMLAIQERFWQQHLVRTLRAHVQQWPAHQILLGTAFQQDVRATLVSLGQCRRRR